MSNYIKELKVKGGVVNVGDSHTVPKALTTQTGLANDIDFIGRKEELKKVDELLNQNSMLLLLNGIGGIGKSTLASYYLNQKKANFDYYGFVQVNEDIKESFASAFSTSLDLKSEDIDELFAETMNKLNNLEGTKLLIIDDIKEMGNQLDEINTLLTLKNSGFQILFTSREVKEYIPQYFLDSMSIDDARDLFSKHYPTDEIDKVDKVLEYLDYHTLFIEMTAKTLKNKSKLTLEKLIEKFENGEFSKISVKRKESFNAYLTKLFNFEGLDEAEILLLKQFSILPSIGIRLDELETIFQRDNIEFEELLKYMSEKGWLMLSTDSYKLHQIIKEYILSSHTPTIEEIEPQVELFFKQVRKSSASDPLAQKLSFLPFFESISQIFTTLKLQDKRAGVFVNDLAYLYHHMGDYQKALHYFKQSLKIREEIGDKSGVGTTLNNISQIYKARGDLPTALTYLQKSLKIREEIGDKSGEGTTLNNISQIYQARGDLPTALTYLQKSLKIYEEIGDKSGEGATLNNISTIYQARGELPTALTYLQKSLKIQEEIGDKSGEGTTLNNISQIYQARGDLPTALTYLQKSLKIREEIGDKSGMCATLFNIGHIHLGNDEVTEAIGSWVKVYKIAKEIENAQALDALESLAEGLGLEGGLDAWERAKLTIG